MAEGLDFFNLTTDGIKDTLIKVLSDRKYAINAKKLSSKFKDQKEKPLDRAIWWIEWLIRNPDADYLKSPVLELGYIAGNAYDVIAFITIISFVASVGFIIILIKILYRKSIGRREMNSSIKKLN